MVDGDGPSSQPSEADAGGDGGGFGSLGSVVGLLLVAWAAVIASFPLTDNSFFTHLATGRLILDTGSVPTSDPYTYTALGADWTVQSWLASVAYAGAERLGGDAGLRVLMLVVYAVAVLLVWRLTRPATSLIGRLGVAAGAMFVFTDLWGERPYMIGIIGLAIVWLALDGAVRPWLLVPLLWVWANAHGSFPLAGVLAVSVLAGSALDRGRGSAPATRAGIRSDLKTELDVLASIVIGTVLAVVGPLGLDVLTFPLKAVTQSDVLSDIVEWQPPGYRIVPERMFLVLLLVAIACVARLGRWRFTLPTIVFGGAAVLAQRNVVMATIVLLPVIATGLPHVGTLTSRTKPSLAPVFAMVCGAFAVLAGVVAVTTPAVDDLGGYPGRPIAWLGARGIDPTDTRIVTQDFTGNLLEVLDGPTGSVFVDDRADMFPVDVFRDNVALVRGDAEWVAILEDQDTGLVVWERSRPLASLLSATPAWRIVFSDARWIVACRRGPACSVVA